MSRTRIVVADSGTIFRAGVRNVLEREKDLDVEEADTLPGLLDACDRERADIALVDLALPPRDGIAAVCALRERNTASAVVWSLAPNPETVVAALRAGAAGYLHKEISPAGLVRALRGVARGEAPMSRHLTRAVVDALHGLDAQQAVRDRAAALSAREREVLALVARGARNRDIAAELVISEFTVKRHVQNILQKLELRSRGDAGSFYHAVRDPLRALPSALVR